MRMDTRHLYFLFVGLLLFIPSVSLSATGISYQEIVGGLDDPTDLVFLWEGVPAIVAERCGDIESADEKGVNNLGTLKDSVDCQQLEAGLIGLASVVNSDASADLFLYFTAKGSAPKQHKIVRIPIERNDSSVALSMGQQSTILDELPAFQVPRGGGGIGMGSDGMLYVGVGDDGKTNWVQDLTKLHGKVLRLTVDGSAPDDNPTFAGAPADSLAEIFAIGLRRPVRIGVDSLSGEVWIADVGASGQEVNRSTGGENFGWPTNAGEFTEPVHSYGSTPPLAIVVGAPYRAESGEFRFPDSYSGAIPMADFYQSWVKVLQPDDGEWTAEEITASGPVNVRAIVTGLDGGLYFVEAGKNAISRLAWTDKPPEVTIESPSAGHHYSANETLPLKATAVDEGQVVPGSGFLWQVTLFGKDDTAQDTVTLTGKSKEYTLPGNVDTEGRLEINLTVTDEAGSTGVASVILYPGATSVTFSTVPEEGVVLSIDDEEITSVLTRLYLPGTILNVRCPQEVILGDDFDLYTFQEWSDGGEPTHDFIVPATDVTLTCTLSLHGPPPLADAPRNIVVDGGVNDTGSTNGSGGGSGGGCAIRSQAAFSDLWVLLAGIVLLLLGLHARRRWWSYHVSRCRVTRPDLWA
jgi:glucose/arabinose dehydrogenase